MMVERSLSYLTKGDIRVCRTIDEIAYEGAIEPLIDHLDTKRGVLLASSFEYPGRYTRWDIGFVDPPIEVTCRERDFTVRALNARGWVLAPVIANAFRGCEAIQSLTVAADSIEGTVRVLPSTFPEEDRTRQPTVFSVLRAFRDLFASNEDLHLGLYGAFGYDLAFQFDPVRQKLARPADHRDLVLYLPDEILIVDHRRAQAQRYRYEFQLFDASTDGLPRDGEPAAFETGANSGSSCDHQPGGYADTVRRARAEFAAGNLFEAVPGQVFSEPALISPSALFRELRERNPAPYGALMNLGEGEFLVAASPEMFVRVDGGRVETCPISGTIARGRDAVEDAAQILTLLKSEKEESELTMCTDVDRNDKARICAPESIRIIGRRQIEMYSRLIHTVDHVEGWLRPGYDALDAFLTHCWAVTVTGAPKLGAMQFIEDNERSPRAWYGGAIGYLGFDGNLNTGLTLRTVRIKDGVAQVRAGATLLYDSDPDAEEAETRLKASALLAAIRGEAPPLQEIVRTIPRPCTGPSVLMIDHNDSFVHMLAAYFRAAGGEVSTVRHHAAQASITKQLPDLAVLSPGPGRPDDFEMSATIGFLIERGVPIFGVCLGMQGIVEHFGGALDMLPHPVHGKRSIIKPADGRLFDGMRVDFEAGRYHSLVARSTDFPTDLTVTARTSDGIIMAVEHRDLPVTGVQFHPESLMTLRENMGQRLISNVMSGIGSGAKQPNVAA